MPTQIIAHRGASKLAPENTMAAFKLAYQSGADGIETDVHLTKDNIPVLIHDERVNRTSNGFGYINNFTLNQIKQLDVGSWFSNRFADTTIITLEEFLQWIQPKRLSLNIELKNNKIDYKNMECITYEMIEHYQLLDRTTLSTFNADSVKRMKYLHNVEIAFLTSKKNKHLIEYTKSLGANALHIKYRLLNSRLVKKGLQENITIRVYTINRRAQMIRCFAQKCNAIFTDVPDRALKYRKLLHVKNKYVNWK